MTMEKIIISDVCGLCLGCKTAIDTAKKQAKIKKVALFKEIVHNKNANKSLEKLGIRTINSLDEANPDEHIILRAHGEPPETYQYLKEHRIDFSDCTCKSVTKIHDLVQEFSQKGYQVIIIGKYGKMHPEILGTIGWCKNEPILIENEDDISKIISSQKDKFYLVCQTTFNEAKADDLIDKINNLCKRNQFELIVNKSICFAQKAINETSVKLAKNCDIMIVVGGKNSSNSLELFNNISSFTKAIFIEDINTWHDELIAHGYEFNKDTIIGLTAGASTLKEELISLKQLIEEKQNLL